jgi:hypothetical protein
MAPILMVSDFPENVVGRDKLSGNLGESVLHPTVNVAYITITNRLFFLTILE